MDKEMKKEMTDELIAHLTKGHPIDGLNYRLGWIDSYSEEFGNLYYRQFISFEMILKDLREHLGDPSRWWTTRPNELQYPIFGSYVRLRLQYAPREMHPIGNHELEVLSRLAELPEGLTSKEIFEEIYKPKNWSRGIMRQDLKRMTGNNPVIIKRKVEERFIYFPVFDRRTLLDIIKREYKEREEIVSRIVKKRSSN